MSTQLYTNNAESTVVGSLLTTDTTIALASTTGARFPVITGADYFLATLYELNSSGLEINYEIVKVTGRTGDTLTVVRGFDDTTARAYPSNSSVNPTQVVYVSLRWTAYPANNILTKDDNLLSVANATTARTNLSAAKSGDNTDITSLTAMTGGISTVDYIQMDLAPSPTPSLAAGKMWWDATGTLNIGMGNGNITQQVGEEIFIYGKASAITNEGQAVVKTGTLGSSGVITFAPAPANLTDPNAIIGVATENIANNSFGRITSFGIVRGIDTTGSSVGESWVDNDDLYYNPVGSGKLTKVKPSAPNVKTQVATVINAGSGGAGSLQILIQPGTVFGGSDTNVQFGSLANGQVVIYDAVDGYWKNNLITAGTGVSITNGAGSLTITNSGITSLGVSAPIASTGGTTPTISMAKATSLVDGYLSATDWTTFNSKGSGSVTSVSGTGSVNGITLTGTVTSSGDLTLGGTLSGIGNSQLTNSSVTVNGTTIALGASGTITAANPNALSAGTGLSYTSGTTFDGSAARTLDLDDTAVTPGSYTIANITVDAQGRITAASNGTVDVLPSQTGNAGKYLTTDGTDASWATLTVDPAGTALFLSTMMG